MSSDNAAIVIAQRFPFREETGEMYLFDEIKVLAEYFSRIIVLSCYAEGIQPIHALPQNVFVFSISPGSDGLFQKRFGLEGFLWACVGRSFGKTDALSFKQRIYLNSMELMVASLKKKASEIIDSNQSLFEHVELIYSYRMTTTASVAINCRNILSGMGQHPKLVTRAHGYDLYENVSPCGKQPFREEVLEEFDSILPCSQVGCDYLQSKHPEQKEKIVCSYLGSQAPASLNFKSNDGILRIVSCSNVNEVKRVVLIAESIKSLEDEGILVRWIHIGSGPLMKPLKQYCEANLISGSFTLMGPKAHEEVFQIYQRENFDLFVSASASEGIPQAIMEAYSFGIPAIATDVGGTKEIVSDGINGFLIEPHDVARSLVKAIKHYLGLSSSQMDMMRAEAYRRWNERFNADINARSFLSTVVDVESNLGDQING